ncbi:MAG: amino acid adenylation domain-containing protein [Chloroflexi bacterium]|nr:amino acid adenylation domain-containing protein [Chloroflexota bacterium]
MTSFPANTGNTSRSEEGIFVFPASFAQRRLWFLDHLVPNSPVYNVSAAVRFSGTLSVVALEQSLNEIIRRHQVLRTTFAMVDREVVQVIAASLTIELPIVDLQDLADVEQEAQVHHLALEEAQQAFDLMRGPLLRTIVLRLGESERVLLLTIHHIVSDGWSMEVFTQEVMTLYEAFSTGQPSPLPELLIQYADFTVWQRKWLQGEGVERLLVYWKEQLGDNVPVLKLPTDYPRPPVQTFHGATQTLAPSRESSEVLKELSRREEVTLFMTLLAAFKTLLYRYTGQEDVVVGTPIANRNQSEIEGLIGFFVNMLVLRTNLEGNPSFRELLGRVREVALGAYAHQDLPFEILVDELQLERDTSRTPLFQVMFALENAPLEPPELPGLTLNLLETDNRTAKFDLTLSMTETAQGLRGALEYNTDLFDEGTIARLVDHFRVLLQGIVADPDQRISDLPLLTETERQQLLAGWNDTWTEYPKGACIHELFELQEDQTPDAVAVVFSAAGSPQGSGHGEDQHLTYRELSRRANQLAHHLRGLGVGPEILVGICVERSLEMIVGLMGIIKAGGAYVPLDPAYPQERLALMLEDSQAAVLLTQQRLVERMPEHEARVVCLDTDWETIAQQSQENPISGATADNLAYVIYTSGSTGKPKGVQVLQRAAVNFLESMRQQPGLTEQDILLSVTTLSFDIAVLELFLPLAVAARVVLVNRAVAADGVRLMKVLATSRTTLMQATPATWRLLLESGWQGSDGVRILCGGEALPSVLADELMGQSAALWNMYGPTETTVWSSIYEVKTAGVPITIGRPIANTEMYLLDDHLTPVPIGVPGELYIGGDGLARGYFDRPKLTAQAFIPNPFSDEKEKKTGTRLYKTGDLARYLPDGNIEFLGRADHQVKVRGFRIELGEIETVLSQHSAVRETVVVALKDRPGGARLVAYVVPNQGQAPALSELRSALKSQLPDYMVPAAFVVLEALPLTPNGKVDRRALPAPDTEQPDLANDFVAPRTLVEEMLAGIWCRILGIEQVGIYDNFFHLGGHSLLATQVVSCVRDVFQVELPLQALFEEPSVADLAERIRTARRAEQGLQVPPLAPVVHEEEIPLSFAQQRLWFMDQLVPDNPAYNAPNATRLMGPLDVAALMQTLDEIVRRHETLRTTFVAVDGRPIQAIAPALPVPLPVVDMGPLPEIEREAEARRLATEEAWRPFDLEQGPLLRVTLLRMDVKKHVLLLTMHHIVSDGWSMGVLIQEVGVLYQAFTAGKPSPLAELPIQYADFAVWQREWLRGEVLEEQLSYWKEQLDGMPELLELPTDRPRPPTPTFRGAGETFELSMTLTEALKTLSQREGVTLFMTLLAAFQTLLYRYTGQEDTVVGSSIGNRNRSEITGLIGFFVNTLVLRTDLSGNPTFRELLGRVREVTLDAYAHQDLPFEMLVEELRLKRDTSYNPLCQVVFVFQNAPMPELELPELTLSGLDLDSRKSSFDLILSMRDTEQGLLGTLEYSTHLFDAVTITRMLNHFKVMLEEIVACPEQLLLDIPLSGDEPSRLVEDASSLRAKEFAQFDFRL